MWEYVSAVMENRDEQVCLNQALEEMEIQWSPTTTVDRQCQEGEGWEGEEGGGLRVLVFAQRTFCRRDCCKTDMPRRELYLVHPFSKKGKISSKVRALRKMGAWFINDQ